MTTTASDVSAGAWLAVPVAIALSLTVRGAVLAKLWAWFVVPTFAVDHLGWVNAAGLSIATQVLVAESYTPRGERLTGRTVVVESLGRSMAVLAALGIGAVVAVAR